MDDSSLRALLDQLASGRTSVETAYGALSALPFADLGFARVDHHRPLRQGFPEAVYAPGKTIEQCRAIVVELLAEPGAGPILLTRVSPEVAAAVLETVPGGRYLAEARLGVWAPRPARRLGAVAVVCAGTSDLPVADEAAAVLSALGWPPTRCNDVGVAGLHRLLAEEKKLRAVDVVIVVAGMEGALASAVGGLVAAPVVAVPTSTGYGASFAGLTALLAMLASCAPGVTAVGIDNGYGAACAAARLLGTIDRREPEGSVEPTP
ncbi:MAG: nickel pincer cofactor biosynthesis protein LarB [Acidimicrobiia bacterium]